MVGAPSIAAFSFTSILVFFTDSFFLPSLGVTAAGVFFSSLVFFFSFGFFFLCLVFHLAAAVSSPVISLTSPSSPATVPITSNSVSSCDEPMGWITKGAATFDISSEGVTSGTGGKVGCGSSGEAGASEKKSHGPVVQSLWGK